MQASLVVEESMAQLKCPSCSKEFVRRVSRVGTFERLLSLFFIYPFKCQLCDFRFRARQSGVRYTRIEEDHREYKRMEVSFPVTFSGPGAAGEGMVCDISMNGCSIATSAEVRPGAIIGLELKVALDAAPVTIDAAVVRHVGQQRFGVQFLKWQHQERNRLQLYIRGLLIGR